MQNDRQTSALADLRRQQGLSREGLAFKAGVSLRTIERIEAGDVVPRRATAHVLADALGVETSDLELDSAAA
jgi:transcriptional regulator with XRE-family HTH domain